MTLEEYLQKEYSPTSVNSYKNIINRYKLALGERTDKASYTEVLDYIGLLREQNLHPKSLRNNLFAIKIYYRYLVATGKRKDHPCQYLYLKDQINRAIQVESLYPKEILTELYNNYQAKNQENQQRDKILTHPQRRKAITDKFTVPLFSVTFFVSTANTAHLFFQLKMN